MSSRKVGAPSVGRWSCSRGWARLWDSAEEPKPPLPSGINGEGCTCLGYDCLVGSVTRSTERGCPRSSEAPQEGLQGNVLKPVPQPPLEPELDLNKASGTKLFWGRPCHVDAQHGPKQEAGVQGGGTAPLVGSGAKPQKPAMICTYYNQLYNGKCYSCTQLSTLHFVINLLEPACDMLARGWPRAGTRN